MASRIYSSETRAIIEQRTVDLLNAAEDLVAGSPRGVGDAVQELLGDRFQEVLGDLAGNYSSSFARRAMADLAFTDTDGGYHVVDVKTHRADTKFNMPNLVSVERLARFYEDDTNVFAILYLRYKIVAKRVVVEHAAFVPIEWLAWSCLTLGALGWGQIQIANASFIEIAPETQRRTWMLQLCDELLEFYPKEMEKIEKRILHFEKVRSHWLSRGDDAP
jgi:hypothetical protein